MTTLQTVWILTAFFGAVTLLDIVSAAIKVSVYAPHYAMVGFIAGLSVWTYFNGGVGG